MEVNFRTKEEANKEQIANFLSLSPIERINSFLNLVRTINKFPTKKVREMNDNFIIE